MGKCMYSAAEINNFRDWMKDIEQAKQLRALYKPQMFFKRIGKEDAGYYDTCRACGARLKVQFGDYGKPLAEQFIRCPAHSGDGHGAWASAINLILN